jgi:hypothetical protein
MTATCGEVTATIADDRRGGDDRGLEDDRDHRVRRLALSRLVDEHAPERAHRGRDLGKRRPAAQRAQGEHPRRRARVGGDHQPRQRGHVAGGRRAQHARLAEAIHEPPLRHRPERVGRAERAHHAARLGERARRVAGQQQDPQAEHPDRHRPQGRQDDRRPRTRQGEQRAVALPTHPRVRQDAHARPRYRP